MYDGVLTHTARVPTFALKNSINSCFIVKSDVHLICNAIILIRETYQGDI